MFSSPLKKHTRQKIVLVYPAAATRAILTTAPARDDGGLPAPRRKEGHRVTNGGETSPSVWSANTVIAWNIILGTPLRMTTEEWMRRGGMV